MSWCFPCKEYPFLGGIWFKIATERAQSIRNANSALFHKFKEAYSMNKLSKLDGYIGIGLGRLIFDIMEKFVHNTLEDLTINIMNKKLMKKLTQSLILTILLHPMKAHVTVFTTQRKNKMKTINDFSKMTGSNFLCEIVVC